MSDWYKHETLGLKLGIRIKEVCETTFSQTFYQRWVRERQGYNYLLVVCHFLWIDTTMDFFQIRGMVSVSMQLL